jgi:hypothetical protein
VRLLHRPYHMYKYLIVFFLLISILLSAKAQNQTSRPKETSKDSINLHEDSITSKPFTPKVKQEHKKYHPDSLHSPHKAVIRSMILPGLGQVYNHQWWKVPIIYTALGLLGDAYFFNERYYREFLALSKARERPYLAPLPGSKYYNDYILYQGQQTQTIYNIKDSYRRDRDLSIMGFAAFWGVQMVDAYIDAKFKHSYTMDTDLSYNVGPTIINQQSLYAQSLNSPIIPGIKLTFILR